MMKAIVQMIVETYKRKWVNMQSLSISVRRRALSQLRAQEVLLKVWQTKLNLRLRGALKTTSLAWTTKGRSRRMRVALTITKMRLRWLRNYGRRIND